jgi:hypothetical protein
LSAENIHWTNARWPPSAAVLVVLRDHTTSLATAHIAAPRAPLAARRAVSSFGSLHATRKVLLPPGGTTAQGSTTPSSLAQTMTKRETTGANTRAT